MDIKFSNDSVSSQQGVPSEKKNQKALVLLLLILIGGFTYLYFFTGLIKPQEAQKTVEAPAAAPQVVNMPLPPRDGDVAKPKEKSASADESSKAAAPVVVATVPAAKPVAAQPLPAKPAAAPVTVPPVKVAPTPPAPKAKEEVKKSAEVKPAEKTPPPVAVAVKKTAAATAVKPGAKKAGEVDKKAPPTKEAVKKPAANGTSKAKAAVSAKAAVEGPWLVIVGNYVLEEALSVDLGRVRKSGFEPIVKPGSRKKTSMTRLLVSEFNERASAQATLEKLQRLTSDAFVIDQGGKYVVFAGSYLKSEAAHSEKERLKAAGFTTTLKRMDLAIPSQTLSVGPFASKKAADAARGKLQRAGLKVTLSQP